MMRIYDRGINSWVGLGEASTKVSTHHFTLKGQRVEVDRPEQLEKLAQEVGQSAILVMSPKPSPKDEGAVQKIVNSKAMSMSLTERQLEMVKQDPGYLFDSRVSQYQFVGWGEQVSQERVRQLERDVLRGGKEWKQASLEELEPLSKNYVKMLQEVVNSQPSQL